MHRLTNILYALSWVAYMVFSVVMLPLINTNVFIPCIPLAAVGGWLYGTTRGLMILIPLMIYHFIIMSILMADLIDIYQNRLVGMIILIIVIFLTGRLREGYEDLKESNRQLDRMVKLRTSELHELAVKLINKSEHIRITQGQQIHDGIGQQLAGIQLFCTSLAEQLIEERNPAASLALSLRLRAGTTHNMMRKAARMLFPVRIAQSGVKAALDELASCFQEMKKVQFDIEGNDLLIELRENKALQIYRIIQETALYVADTLCASDIRVSIDKKEHMNRLQLEHNGIFWEQNEDCIEKRLIAYRLQEVGGTMTITGNGPMETITFTIPAS